MSHSEVSTSQRNHDDFSGARSALAISVKVLMLADEVLRRGAVGSARFMMIAYVCG